MPLILSGSSGLSGNVGTTTRDMLPIGTVLQVVQSSKSDNWSTTSQSFVDIPNLVAIITPTSTTNKILVLVEVNVCVLQHGDVRLARTISGSQSVLAVGDTLGSRTRSSVHHYMYTSSNTTYDTHSDGIKYLDSPSTVSSVTYSVQAACPYSSGYWIGINRQYSEADASYAATTFSSITLMEIKA